MLLEQLCGCQGVFGGPLETLYPLDPGDGVVVIQLVRGNCRAEVPQGPPIEMGMGSMLLSPALLVLEPTQPGQLMGAYLSGAGAQLLREALAQSGPGPLVLEPARTAGADLLLGELVEGLGRMVPAQVAELCCRICCRLGAALEQAARRSPLVEAALEEIHHHYRELYGVQELADALEVSKGHLHRLFIREVGVSPGRYLTLVRLSHAKRLLLHRDYPLEVVAGLCGFSGANYFCKVFKKETGETPAQWRSRAAADLTPLPLAPLDQLPYL